LQQILSPNREDQGVWIYQDAWFHIGKFDSGFETTYAIKRVVTEFTLLCSKVVLLEDCFRWTWRTGYFNRRFIWYNCSYDRFRNSINGSSNAPVIIKKALNLLGCDQLFSNFYYNYEKNILYIGRNLDILNTVVRVNANENWFAIGASTDSEAQKLLKNIKLRLYC
jgi:hypothetical protein